MYVIIGAADLNGPTLGAADDATEILVKVRANGGCDGADATLRTEDEMVVEAGVGLRHGLAFLSPLWGWRLERNRCSWGSQSPPQATLDRRSEATSNFALSKELRGYKESR
jgi:hypothetical protein